MHVSTIALAILAFILSTATGMVVWQLRHPPAQTSPHVEGAMIAVGPPGGDRGGIGKDFDATSALVWNTNTQSLEFEQNGFVPVPIASLTKLMTAMVAIDYGLPWETVTTIELREYVYGGKLLLHPGEAVSVKDLFHASLIGSANNATLAYVRALGVPEEEFVQAMNRKAIELGLEQTHFVEVTGLDKHNVASAYDAARLAAYAFSHYPLIAEATRAPEYAFTVGGSNRAHTIRNTNKLIAEAGAAFGGSKTGYLYEAGYCLVVQGSGPHTDRIAIILGSNSETGHFADIQRLLEYPAR